MRYQKRNSTVPFTNMSTHKDSVTAWSWWLDSGSGFTQVANTENADITFPDTPGVVCKVKLIAHGPWSNEIAYEEEFTIVEDPDPPEILQPTGLDNLYGGNYVDVVLDVAAGTGTGQLTWEIPGGHAVGLKIDSQTGRLTGCLRAMHGNSWIVPVKVTDASGREGFRDIVFTVSKPGVLAWFDGSRHVQSDPENNNALVRWDSDFLGIGAHASPHLAVSSPTVGTFEQGSYLDMYDAERQFYVGSRHAGFLYDSFTIVYSVESITQGDTIFAYLYYSYNSSFKWGAQGYYPGNTRLQSVLYPRTLPTDKFIYTIIRDRNLPPLSYIIAENGVKRAGLYFDSPAADKKYVAEANYFGRQTTITGVSYYSAKMKIYDIVYYDAIAEGDTGIISQVVDPVQRELGLKHGIPVKHMSY